MPYEDSGNGGNSGSSGLSAEFVEHDSKLVTVVDERKKHGIRPEVTVVAPMIGRAFCWEDFQKSLAGIDHDHLIVYDNSNDPEHEERIDKLLSTYRSWTLIRDFNQPLSVESHGHPPDLVRRCSEVYESIYSHLTPESGIIVNLEDDIGVTADQFHRLRRGLDLYPEIGTLIGDCRCRRAKMLSGRDISLACNFREYREIGGAEREGVKYEFVQPKPLGFEAIGGGHMGLWITRAEVLREVGMVTDHDHDLKGHDFQYGYRANQLGHRMAVDWSVKLEHIFEQDGRKVSI